MLRRVGRGGLNEATGPSDEAESSLLGDAGPSLEGTGHRSAVVAGTEIIRQPSEAEQVLRLLTTQLRSLRSLPASSGAAISLRQTSVCLCCTPAFLRDDRSTLMGS